MKRSFIDDFKETTVLDETAVLAMSTRMIVEVGIRSFLRWCFEEYGEQAKLKYNGSVYKFIAVNDLGYVTGIDDEGKEVHLHPREVITRIPTKAFRFFQEEWLSSMEV